jgi:gamma-glutamyl:cysteine ligase YbdK (ATP-grasp superfamily)
VQPQRLQPAVLHHCRSLWAAQQVSISKHSTACSLQVHQEQHRSTARKQQVRQDLQQEKQEMISSSRRSREMVAFSLQSLGEW